MLYVALGDSITYGYCSTSPDMRYAARLQKLMGGRRAPDLFVHAQPGWTSARLLQSVQRIPAGLWDETQLVTLVIGGNDLLRSLPFLLHGSPASMLRISNRLYANICAILDLVSRPHTTILLGKLYNPFPNSPVAERFTTALNRAVEYASDREGVSLVDIQTALEPKINQCIEGYKNGQLRDFRFVGNPIHPNDVGHELIARTFHAAYRKSLKRSRDLQRKLTL